MSIDDIQYHEHHKIISQKMLDGIIETGNEVLAATKEVGLEYWNKIIPSSLNHLIFDLNVAVHNYQQIEIKSKSGKSEKAELQYIINAFAKIAYKFQQEFSKNKSDISKSLFEIYIPQIVDLAKSLLCIIDENKFYEFKSEQVNLLNAILIALNKLATTLKMEHVERIKNVIEEKLQSFKKLVLEIDYDRPNKFEQLKKHRQHANMQIPKIVFRLVRESKRFEGVLKNEILKTSDAIRSMCSKLLADLEESKSAKEAAVHIQYIYNQLCSIVVALIEVLISRGSTTPNLDRVYTLARYLGNQIISILNGDIIYFKSDDVGSPTTL